MISSIVSFFLDYGQPISHHHSMSPHSFILKRSPYNLNDAFRSQITLRFHFVDDPAVPDRVVNHDEATTPEERHKSVIVVWIILLVSINECKVEGSMLRRISKEFI